MLTVWSVFWGDKYPEYYVKRLQWEVAKHLPLEHEFVCLSDRDVEGVHTVPAISDKPGWWQKIDMFAFKGRNLYLDLDTVPVGDLTPFVGTGAEVRTLKNWAQSGHGGCQSSIMYWEDAQHIYREFDEPTPWPPVNKPGVLWGDQEYITKLRDRGLLDVDYFHEAHGKSYKYHCRNGLPADCRAVIFHGKPDPDEVSETWLTW